MQDLDLFTEEDSDGTVFRDVVMLMLGGFLAIVLLLLPHLNPPAMAEDSTPPPGNVIVEILWPDKLDTDVDLWVEAPGDVPVGYSNKGGQIFNLLRDDLGHRDDITNVNYEISYSRGVPAGEYTVNLHLYRNNARVYPIPVTVVVSLKTNADAPARRLVSTKLDLGRTGQELTAVRFAIDADGKLVPGSIHSVYRALRGRR